MTMSTSLKALSILLYTGATLAFPASPLSSSNLLQIVAPSAVPALSLNNIHIDSHHHLPQYLSDREHGVTFTISPCSQSSFSEEEVLRSFSKEDAINFIGRDTSKLLWISPASHHLNDFCINAYHGSQVIARSDPVFLTENESRKRSDSVVAQMEDFDSLGTWFDGVNYVNEHFDSQLIDVQSKESAVGIVGAGMSGLMTALLLDSVGMHNWEIIESSDRIGGRLYTQYLNNTQPDEYQYQEMGAMRFPVSWVRDGETVEINDHKLVFQLGDYLNKLNDNAEEWKVGFIPWVQSMKNNFRDANGVRLADGSIPRVSDINANPSLSKTRISDKAKEASVFISNITDNTELLELTAENVFKAHKMQIDLGYDDVSEAGLLQKYGYDLITAQEAQGFDFTSVWDMIYDSNNYFGATTWKTIDRGLSQLPNAFHPLVDDKVSFKKRVDTIKTDDGKVTLEWTDEGNGYKRENKTFDYTVVASPFSVVRQWDLPVFEDPIISHAIDTLTYNSACKTALQFKKRFWEEGDKPIYGGCDDTDKYYGVSRSCYPPYNLGSDGPAVVLSSYVSGDPATRLASWSEDRYVQQAMESLAYLHGDQVYEQYAGNSAYRCWIKDENYAGSWASPTQDQHTMFIPSYHKTHDNVIFVGEHTSITHAWTFSALESAVRGSVQLLLHMGLVDEAKQINSQWMGRWIKNV
ncbi:hypothetical protein E3P77_03782 [Wallemia ichthyophaga]|uniref:Amine oxidase domain-containing protein n=1 Tax=Wallemia ichthyophaga TaxID=245174 RepID=A0A4T0HTV8_WALIC|nr:hypothetical protein E3P95_03805 [Wallemia ichthyophaga]TIA96149.1 hypothetical protein E3P94_03800 [Wallemia ichthyophaga]TIB07848.1 hypothetical protein E3P93_03707 [Wallemia ichthyophaga]TIB08578.1 hypothetical protein E3P90_03628 [Wallemia ichthyophaga]TIB19870.1 hypothetical protein E3P89_03581 [Wallemia ichthyophaga]